MADNPLAGLEDRIQRLIEGGLARLLAGHLHPREVAIQLARAMEDCTTSGERGQTIAPDTYLIRLNPQDQRAILEASPNLIAALAAELVDVARRASLLMRSAPHVKLLADVSIELHHVAITAYHSEDERESTEAMPKGGVWGIKKPETSQATLLLSPGQSIPLKIPVINVGRDRDNQIIVDNPGVSRHHAQLRLRFGRYTLFDLGSSGGTTVNGQPVQEAALQSGDVIGLAGTNLIFVDEGLPLVDSLDGDATGAPPPS